MWKEMRLTAVEDVPEVVPVEHLEERDVAIV